MKEKTWRRVIFLLAACLFTLTWLGDTLDIDAYYMIAQGREILDSGIPHTNNWTYVPGLNIILQQAPYCILMALAAKIPYNFGLYFLMIAQAMLVYAAYVRIISKYAKTEFQKTISMLSGIVLMYFIVRAYHISLRPENLTMLMLLFQCHALEKYRDTKNRLWLITIPVLTFLEANVHASMVIFHYCILAAYCIKLPDRRVKSNRIEFTPFLAAMIVLSVGSAALNPYGLNGILYAKNSMGIFDHIMMREQDFVRITSFPGIMLICVTCAIAWVYAKRRFESSQLNLCLGFTFLAFTSYHGNMMLPLVACLCLQKIIPGIDGEKISAFIAKYRKNFRLIGIPALCFLVFLTGVIGARKLPSADIYRDTWAVKQFLDQRPAGNIVNYIDTGSYLEYCGYKGLFADTRPELLYYKVNGGYHGEEVADWLGGCTPSEFVVREYNADPQAYLDKYDIQYVIDDESMGFTGYLDGWLDGSGNWDKFVLSDIDPDCPYTVWVRKEAKQ